MKKLSPQWKTKSDRFVHQRTKFGCRRTNFKDAVDYLWSRPKPPNWDKSWKTKARVFYFGNDLTDFTVKLITFSIPNNLNPARATNTFRTKCNNFHNIHHDGSIPVCPANPYILNDRGNPPGRVGGEWVTAIYGLHVYVPLWRVWFSTSLL